MSPGWVETYLGLIFQLTGIANRRRTQQVIEQEIDRFNRYTVPAIAATDKDYPEAITNTH